VLGEYVYGYENDTLYINQFADSTLSDGGVSCEMTTKYPLDGKVCIKADGVKKVAVRIPSWCEGFELNKAYTVENGYAVIDRLWQDGDRIELALDMPVTLVRANPRIYEDVGKVAVSRGPLVYCLEEVDNSRNLHNLSLVAAAASDFQTVWKADKLGGIVELKSPGLRETDDGWGETPYSGVKAIETQPVTLTWIPYYSWANRDPGEMRVWIRR
jgi:DUF1680 family protein